MSLIHPIVDRYLQAFPIERERLQPLTDLISRFTDELLISRKNFEGHITASGFVIDPSRQKVLLIQHKTLRRFLQPGGHVESEDASPLAAAIREIREETNITTLEHIPLHHDLVIPIDIDIHPIPARQDEPEHLHHDFRYLFVSRNPSEFVWIKDECNGYEWRNIDDLMRLDSYQRLRQKLQTSLREGFSSDTR